MLGSKDAHTLYVAYRLHGDLSYFGLSGPTSINIYQGAPIISSLDPDTSVVDGAKIQLETNDAQWGDGDGIENENYIASEYQAANHSITSTDPYGQVAGEQVSVTAATVWGHQSAFEADMAYPTTYLSSRGGPLSPLEGISLKYGVVSSGLAMDYAPESGNGHAPALLYVNDIAPGNANPNVGIYYYGSGWDYFSHIPSLNQFAFNGQNGAAVFDMNSGYDQRTLLALQAAPYNGSNPVTAKAFTAGTSASPVNMFVDFYGNVSAVTYQETLYTPPSSSGSCLEGQFADDTNYHYVCVAANTWKRVALGSF